MKETELPYKTINDLRLEMEELRRQLEEATDTIEAIRTGQVDALVVQNNNEHQLYTLKSADQTYRVFIEKMTEGAVTLDAEGLVLYSNSQFARLVQLPLSQVIGTPFHQFIAESDKDEYRLMFDGCWEKDCKGEVSLIAGDGFTPVKLSLTTLELEGGTSLSIILTDLTAQKAAQKQLHDNNEQLATINRALEASNHDLQQFASVASHDLQEPLRKIQIFSHLIKETEEDLSSPSKNHLEKIIVSSSRMKVLIQDILNYSKLSATDHHLQCVDLNVLLHDLLDDFELIIQEKGATINHSALPCVDVNPGQMRQVFQNIISNALKFSRAGEPPVIKVASVLVKELRFDSEEVSNGSYCLLTFSDRGIGFEQKYAEQIFTLFERLNSKDKYEGTGIGLAIAKKIIDKHNGLITATSNEYDGTTFKIVLPLTQNG